MGEALSENDPNSFSNPESCIVTNFDFNLKVDFKEHILIGYVDISVKRINPESHLILDTKDLEIKEVQDKNTNQILSFSLLQPVKEFGSKLEIYLPEHSPKKFVIRVEYKTSPDASGLLWLDPEQTAGKKHPYLFNLCQAIHARSVFPCQDTPAVKTPYTATITAPSELTVLMGAVRDGEGTSETPLMKEFKFVQKVPIPSYLFSIVVGALESRQIGPRSHVWSEKEFVGKSAEEFSETEIMVSCCEEILGDYVWGIYDLLVLPPSFGMGGMEHPCLTFVTPTLLAGDKSMVSTVAHEIAHSWTGNLVSCKNWEHFWLNEGFTVFTERKVIGRLHGEAARHFESIAGWMELETTVKHLGEKHEFTKLVPNLKGIDPDEAFSKIPYEKGYAFLFYLETLLGGPDVFEKFLKDYINEYKYKSIDTDTWKMYLYKYFPHKEDVLNKVDWEAWLYAPGMPPVKPDYDYTLAKKCMDLSQAWSTADDNELGQFTPKDIDEFSAPQIREFLTFLLLERKPLSIKKIEKLNEAYKLGNSHNSEIKFRWIELGLQAHWEDAIPNAIDFITSQGRMKFVSPIYRALYNWDETRELAISTFKKHETEMMYCSRQRVAGDLHLT